MEFEIVDSVPKGFGRGEKNGSHSFEIVSDVVEIYATRDTFKKNSA